MLRHAIGPEHAEDSSMACYSRLSQASRDLSARAMVGWLCPWPLMALGRGESAFLQGFCYRFDGESACSNLLSLRKLLPDEHLVLPYRSDVGNFVQDVQQRLKP